MRAQTLAQFAMMALEGALVMARAEGSDQPILLAVEETAAVFERETTR